MRRSYSVRTPLLEARAGAPPSAAGLPSCSGLVPIRSSFAALGRATASSNEWRSAARRATSHGRAAYHLRDRDDVRSLGALGALTALVLDLRAFDERLEPVAGDRGVMDKEILRPLVRRDEAVALRVVEPLHSSS